MHILESILLYIVCYRDIFQCIIPLHFKLNQECTVVSTTGNRKNAIQVFAMALQFLKEDLLQTIQNTGVRYVQKFENI